MALKKNVAKSVAEKKNSFQIDTSDLQKFKGGSFISTFETNPGENGAYSSYATGKVEDVANKDNVVVIRVSHVERRINGRFVADNRISELCLAGSWKLSQEIDESPIERVALTWRQLEGTATSRVELSELSPIFEESPSPYIS